MAKKQQNYGNESITSLKGADRVRKRPAVIFGSDGLEGCEHAAFEIMSNAIDEARQGYGKEVIVTLFQDHSIQVEDFGRGCPVDYNEKEQRYNWELVFCELYAGGKYDNNSGLNYEFSLGTNGLGSCATQYSSRFFDATVRRDGFKYTLHFEKGNIVGEMKKEPADRKATGSVFHWLPDLEVFADINIPKSYFEDIMRRQSVANKGITFRFRYQLPGGKFEESVYLYEDGIRQYVTELAGESAVTGVQYWEAERKGRDREDLSDYKLLISAALCFSPTVNLIEYYHNSSWLEYGGAPDKAVRNAFVYAIDAYLKQNSKYSKNESKITFQDIQDCLCLVTNCFSTTASYENQTKKAINNKFVQEAMTEFFRSRLQVYFIENKEEADKIAAQVLLNKRSRETAERTRITVKKKLSGSIDITNRVEKFVDCRSKDTALRELYIVEGDSAMGSVKQSRNADFQGIMPVRGKILNCLKADYGRIFKSEIITDLIRVLGCGVEVKDKHVKDLAQFDLSNLRWNKVVICTDADVDGYQIRTLILTMLYRLTPTLIEEGYVYIAESPLFEINTKDHTYFAYSEAEKNEILKQIGDRKFSISRSKGLGENDPEMMWMTTMNPETRRLIKVRPEDADRTAYYFDLLEGDDLNGRKLHIQEHGSEFMELADLS